MTLANISFINTPPVRVRIEPNEKEDKETE